MKQKNKKFKEKNHNLKPKSKIGENKKTSEEIIANLHQKIKKEKEKYLISLANLENDRKMFEKSRIDFIKFANERVISDLIDVLDNFNMAMSTKNPSLEVKKFLKGFEMISKQFHNLLERNGVKEIPVKIKDQFDTTLHHSIEEVQDSGFKNGQIIEILKKGYKINDRLLRTTIVKIVNNDKKGVKNE